MIQQKTYPSIAQSWGIMGVAIVCMLIFSPLQLALNEVLGKEITFLIYYLMSMGATFAFAHFIRKKETALQRYDIRFDKPKIIILVSVAALGLQLGILSPLTSLIPMPDFFKKIILELGNMKGIFAFLTIVVAAPIFEELIFRGIILDGLLKRYSPAKSIFVSSLLFGIVHLNPWQFVTAMGIGAFMGWVYYKTQKLSLCIIIHFINNLLAFLSMQFINLEEELDKTFVESHGGMMNAILLIFGSVIIFCVCSWLLVREFRKQEISIW
ncbi:MULTISPECIES: CPBP family intramembrane glutamic endopeptidase [unclassified Saccharicrinis]|uniref:CPBP family intramembrane glutamic endopeptidase n=1 Tax=unclassified Saccharicrinis TaxID=2646859 RepID=UPI003D339E96